MSRSAGKPGPAGASLFAASVRIEPLAARMRPERLEDVVGQQHLLAVGRPLGDAIRNGTVGSVILTGPSGTGKTTVASLIGRYTAQTVIVLNAVTDGIPRLREIVVDAERRLESEGRRTLVVVDEIHRWAKSQQDALLPHVERGIISLCGATTEVPAFAVVGALLSRCRVYALRPLAASDIEMLIGRALADTARGVGTRRLQMSPTVVAWLAEQSDGDARRALGALEAVATTLVDGEEVTVDALSASLGVRVVAYDRVDVDRTAIMSAFHKSCRGSDPHAALYWLARALVAGEDSQLFLRRLAAIATEDIGLADPAALGIVMHAWEAYRRLGPAEGERAVAQATVYCATAPKSNRLHLAWAAAREAAEATPALPVPAHLLNSEMHLRADEARRMPYQYPHDFPDAFVPQPYQPAELQGRVYYEPGAFGEEKRIAQRLAWWADRGGPPTRDDTASSR
ncbi:replication-associated recombination protein A [Gemmatimonas sp.]|uniref:replication-associated recombination protein A n=1 Tax=Gemmatimonas sp. TaxID=1962908 RepID=UPI0022C0CB6E|nr:replication-associated recombination protein A [Gemmatimonas sp.]MCZ8205660.1 replication-associated recombination protein A [Gemmatimonas sp.]